MFVCQFLNFKDLKANLAGIRLEPLECIYLEPRLQHQAQFLDDVEQPAQHVASC